MTAADLPAMALPGGIRYSDAAMQRIWWVSGSDESA
jgi:hypothetical protein